MVNKVILIGNLGRDPEMRSTPSGQPVVTFSLATNRRRRDQDGNRTKETEWHLIEVWGKLAEIAGQYLKKGSKLYVEGRIKTDTWDDRETGAKRSKTKIVCENFQMLDRREDFDGTRTEGQSFGEAAPQSVAEPTDDDIPF
jgi:single-strand DNA-binding protein